jgi:transcriptional regulator with XRE-family HTH domain
MAVDRIKIQKRLGTVIKEKRKQLGFSQEAFAAKCGIHRTYMGAIERGERNISFMTILQVSHALNIKPSELFEMDNYNP